MSLNELDPGADITEDAGRFQLNTTLDKIARAVRALQAAGAASTAGWSAEAGKFLDAGTQSARVRLATDQTIPDATATAVVFDESVYDVGEWTTGMVLPRSAIGRVVLLQGQVAWDTVPGDMLLEVQIRAVKPDGGDEAYVAILVDDVRTGDGITMNLSGVWRPSSQETFTLTVLQSSGAPLDVLGTETWLSATVI